MRNCSSVFRVECLFEAMEKMYIDVLILWTAILTVYYNLINELRSWMCKFWS